MTGFPETLIRRSSAAIASSPLNEAVAKLDRIVDRLGLDFAARALLRSPMREHHVAIPVRMDDGTTKVFKGVRVQHKVLRKLDSWMTDAFKTVCERADREEVSLRDAAYLIAVDRVARACRERGWV